MLLKTEITNIIIKKVRTCNQISRECTNNKDLRGGVLSPLLFICVMDEVMKKSWKETKKIIVENKNIVPM